MRRLLFPGAVHAIALPSGAYAVRYPGSHIKTHTGILKFPTSPPDDVGYLDMTDVDGIIDANGVKAYKIAGQGQRTYDAWLWDGGWTPQGPNNGSYPACFDGFGQLHIVRPGPGVSSQGFRFPDTTGDLVMGDETVNSATTLAYMLRVSRLYEWTYYAGIAFGQGDSGGLCVQVNDGDHRMLCTGSIHDVRVRYGIVSGVYAIAFYVAGNGVLWDGEHVQNASVLCWMTAPELRASLPPYPPIDVPVDPPDPPPDPPEEPPTVSLHDELMPILEAVNADPAFALRIVDGSAEATSARSIRFLSEVVRRAHANGLTRVGLLRKPSGINSDNLTERTPIGTILHYDVISGGDGMNNDGTVTWQPRLSWGENGPIQAGWSQAFPADVSVSDPPDTPDDPPDDPPVTGDVLPLILAELRRLNQHLGVR